MKRSHVFLFAFMLLSILNCSSEPSEEKLLSEVPLRIAVVCDFTSSQEAINKSIGTRLSDILDPIFDTLLPMGSRIAFFPISDKPEQPFFQVEYNWNHNNQTIKRQYPLKATLWKKALDSAIQSRVEIEKKYDSQARSCIDASLDNAGNYLQQQQHCSNRLLLISDLIAQCSYSPITKGPLHFIGRNAKKGAIDSLATAIDRWNPAKLKLRDTDVVMITIGSESPNNLPIAQIQDVWTKAANRFGASEKRIHQAITIPPWFTGWR